jgi:hypothetical protein
VKELELIGRRRGLTTIGATETKDVPAEALQPSGETQIAEHSTRSDGKLTHETIEQSTTPAPRGVRRVCAQHD